MDKRYANELIARTSDHVCRLGVDQEKATRLFNDATLSRTLTGKRTKLTAVSEVIDRFDKSFRTSPLKIYSRGTYTGSNGHLKKVQFNVARLGVDRSETVFGEPMFIIIGNHYVFQSRWITVTREVAPLVISYHSLKRMAERSPEFERHAYGVLQRVGAVLPFLVTISIILSGAAAKGYLPTWTRVPLPVKDGVFLTELVSDPFGTGVTRFGWRFDKHGYRQIPQAINPKRVTLKISTFISNNMLSQGQTVSVDRLAKLFDSWPETYEKLTRFDKEGYDPLLVENTPNTENLARKLISDIRPFELKRHFHSTGKGLRQAAA